MASASVNDWHDQSVPENKIQNTSSVMHKGVNKLNLLIYQAQ